MSWTITPQQKVKGLLDEFTGAAAAYSLRDLSVLRNAPVVRVRRSSDNTEQDFTATQITDGTLTAFCGAGDGFVRTWYDQSGNNKHATADPLGSPRIVSAGFVEVDNGRPALYFSANDQRLNFGSFSINTCSLFTVLSPRTTLGRAYLGASVSSYISLYDSSSVLFRFSGVNTFVPHSLSSSAQYLHSFSLSSGSGSSVLNGVSVPMTLGATGLVSSFGHGGNSVTTTSIQECIFYSTNQSTNRAAIESNINAHYSIY